MLLMLYIVATVDSVARWRNSYSEEECLCPSRGWGDQVSIGEGGQDEHLPVQVHERDHDGEGEVRGGAGCRPDQEPAGQKQQILTADLDVGFLCFILAHIIISYFQDTS